MHDTRFHPTPAASRSLLGSQSALVCWLESILTPLFAFKATTTLEGERSVR